MNAYLTAVRTAFLRMLRNATSMIVQIGAPLMLIPIIGFSFQWAPITDSYFRGASSVMSFVAIVILIMFQLFGGLHYGIGYVKEDFFKPRKWRLRMLPCHPAVPIFGTVTAGLAVSILQGALMAGLFTLVLDVKLGGFGLILLVFLGLSLFSQFLGVLLLLALRASGPATAVSWIVAYASCALGGLYPLPMEKPVIHFLATYGTPASLAQTALLAGARGAPSSETAPALGALFLISAVLGISVSLLARRRLA
jgi:hypothetical protein